jgi:rhodanese-related sulfurtransferase
MYSPTFPDDRFDITVDDGFDITAEDTSSMPILIPRSLTLKKTSSKTYIKNVLNHEANEYDTVGDFSRPHCLPIIPGRHKDLKCISPTTIAELLNGDFTKAVDEFVVVDCRYPYEFEGGHIKDALNIWQCDSLDTDFFKSDKHRPTVKRTDRRKIIIFHCEFSSERAPKMLRFLRETDRKVNSECYPSLCYPEIYLLEGGYKAFYGDYSELCTPQAYTPMTHETHSTDLRFFRVKAKSWPSGKTSISKRPGMRRVKSLRF